VTLWTIEGELRAGDVDLALRYAAWALHAEAGRRRHGDGVLFQTPRKIDPERLLHHGIRSEEYGVVSYAIDPLHLRRRDGFALTDTGTDLVGALDEASYCIWCHNQGKDSCSKGFARESSEG